MVQPVLAVIILSLTLVSFMILLFSIIFIGCRALGKCGAKRYQPHPTSGRHYSAHLVVFLCSWFLMATASSYYAYCGLHLWNIRPSVIQTSTSSEHQNAIQKRSPVEQSVFDLFDNPDYQGDFEQIETTTSSFAFVTEKIEKGVRPRFPLHRLPRVQDSSEDSPPAVEQLPIFPINFTSRVPLASTVISPIEIPARPKAELDFKRLLDGEKLVTSNYEEGRGEHMSGAFVGDGIPRARNLISSSMKRPMFSLGTPTIRPDEVSAEMNPEGVITRTSLEDDPTPLSSVNTKQSSAESSTVSTEETLFETENNRSREILLETVQTPNSLAELIETTTDVTSDVTTSEFLILSMNNDEPETTEISLDSTVTTTDSHENSEDNKISETAETTVQSSISTNIVTSAVSEENRNFTTSNVQEIVTVSNDISDNVLNDETTPVSLPESRVSEEVTTLASFRSDEVLSTSRPVEDSSIVTDLKSETSTSSVDLSTGAIDKNLLSVLTEETTNTEDVTSRATDPSVTLDELNSNPLPTTTTTTANVTDSEVTSTSRTSVMTESTETPSTTDETTTVKIQELFLVNSENDLSETVSADPEPEAPQEIEERFGNKTEEREESVDVTSTLSPTITVLNTKSQPRRPTTVHTFPHTPLDESERRSITELLASPNLHPFRFLNTTAVVWIHRITFTILSILVLFILPCSLILILIGTICYIRSYHPMDRTRLSEKIGQFTVLLAVLFLFSLPIFILYIAMVLSYNHVYNSICPDIQLQYQHHLGLLIGTSFNTLSSNSHRLLANTENCFRSQEPILGLWMSAAVFVLSALPFVFSLFKLSKYYLRMKTEYYWTIADYGTIYAKRALHTDAIYGNIYGTLRSKRPTSRPPPAPNNENAIYGESPVYGTYSAFGHI
ncbi:unnamed protein product [Auanema sp. JU1783]|nr:unnamed protein product [Auanema sp. JU1783]